MLVVQAVSNSAVIYGLLQESTNRTSGAAHVVKRRHFPLNPSREMLSSGFTGDRFSKISLCYNSKGCRQLGNPFFFFNKHGVYVN